MIFSKTMFAKSSPFSKTDQATSTKTIMSSYLYDQPNIESFKIEPKV